MNEPTRQFIKDTLFSLTVSDSMLEHQVVSLDAILRMIIFRNYPEDFKYRDVDRDVAICIKDKIEELEKSNPHNYIPLVRWYLRDLLNEK